MSSSSPSRLGDMSSSHKEALVNGCADSKLIREYLQLVDAQRPQRGRRRSPERITRRLREIETELPLSHSVQQIHLIQERINLNAKLATSSLSRTQQTQLEKNFIKVAKSFSERHHISPEAWSEFGVSPRVLHLAGMNLRQFTRKPNLKHSSATGSS